MNPAQVEHFRDRGYLKLGGFHPKARVLQIQRKVLDELARVGVWGGGKRRPHALYDLPAFQQIGRLSATVKFPDLHERLVSEALTDVVACLAGRPVPSGATTQLLLSAPHREHWTLDRLNWHVDVSPDAIDRLPGIQAFHLIDDVAPRGGATLGLAGSHRGEAVQRAARSTLKSAANLEAELARQGLGIVEMAGRAGDVFLMDMRMLHTPSINAGKSIRMVATTRFLLPG